MLVELPVVFRKSKAEDSMVMVKYDSKGVDTFFHDGEYANKLCTFNTNHISTILPTDEISLTLMFVGTERFLINTKYEDLSKYINKHVSHLDHDVEELVSIFKEMFNKNK